MERTIPPVTSQEKHLSYKMLVVTYKWITEDLITGTQLNNSILPNRIKHCQSPHLLFPQCRKHSLLPMHDYWFRRRRGLGFIVLIMMRVSPPGPVPLLVSTRVGLDNCLKIVPGRSFFMRRIKPRLLALYVKIPWSVIK